MICNFLLEKIFEYPVKEKIKEFTLDKEDLNLEQLPQIIQLFNPEAINWKGTPMIINGPDGSQIHIGYDNKLIAKTPIFKSSIPWLLKKIKKDKLENLIKYLLPCNNGLSYFNPSPWRLPTFFKDKTVISEPGGLTKKVAEKNIDNIKIYKENEVIIKHNLLNPDIYIINPFYITQISLTEFSTAGFTLELQKAISYISNDLMQVKLGSGIATIHSKGNIIVEIRGKSRKETKMVQLLWNLINDIQEINCTPERDISLYEIIPFDVIPLTLNFDNDTLYMVLFNSSELPVFTTIKVLAKIEKASITDIYGNETEELSPEYDRVKLTIRRWGITPLKLMLRKLPEKLILRKTY